MTERNYNLSKALTSWVSVVGLLIVLAKIGVSGVQSYDNLLEGQKETKDLILVKTNEMQQTEREVAAKLAHDSVRSALGDNMILNMVKKDRIDINKIIKFLHLK